MPDQKGNPVITLAERMPTENVGPGQYTLELQAVDTSDKPVKRTATSIWNRAVAYAPSKAHPCFPPRHCPPVLFRAVTVRTYVVRFLPKLAGF